MPGSCVEMWTFERLLGQEKAPIAGTLRTITMNLMSMGTKEYSNKEFPMCDNCRAYAAAIHKACPALQIVDEGSAV